MRYVIVKTIKQNHTIDYKLVDENNEKHRWVEWPRYPDEPDFDDERTFYSHNGTYIRLDIHIPLNKDNPQQSIDRIKKLQVLK